MSTPIIWNPESGLSRPTITPSRGTGLRSIDDREYPLLECVLRSEVEGGYAVTTLEQRYGNPYPIPLEVLYTMPLPADGAVLELEVQLGEMTLAGEILPRTVSAAQYHRALEEGRTAGLLEQERDDTFTQRLGSLPAGCEVRLRIKVLHPLMYVPATQGSGARWQWRFPTVVGIRYQGDAGRVPDAVKLDVDRAAGGTPVTVSLELNIPLAAMAQGEVRSSSHAIAAGAVGEHMRVGLRRDAALDRDVVVSWPATSAEVGVELATGRGLPGDSGYYALLTITPPATATDTAGRDVTLLIDASGSMDGEPLEQAKAVAEEVLRSLTPRDQLEVCAFADHVKELSEGVVRATRRNVQAVLAALRTLQASGCTEMAGAIEHSVARRNRSRQRQLILLTDGFIGFEAEVIAAVADQGPRATRVHAVGVGSTPNRTLTRGVAQAGRGVELLIGLGDDPRAVAPKLLHATCAPVLTDVQVNVDGVGWQDLVGLNDVMADRPVSAPLELLGPLQRGIAIRAYAGEDFVEWTQHVAVGAGLRATQLPLGALYGRAAVEQVQLAQQAGELDLERANLEIQGLGLRHRIVTSQTSLIAQAKERTTNPRSPSRQRQLEVAVPYGVNAMVAGVEPLRFTSRARMRARNSFEPIESIVEAAYPSGPSASVPRRRLVSEWRTLDYHRAWRSEFRDTGSMPKPNIFSRALATFWDWLSDRPEAASGPKHRVAVCVWPVASPHPLGTTDQETFERMSEHELLPLEFEFEPTKPELWLNFEANITHSFPEGQETFELFIVTHSGAVATLTLKVIRVCRAKAWHRGEILCLEFPELRTLGQLREDRVEKIYLNPAPWGVTP